MDDKSHIRLVNAHAKGDGGHDHVNILAQEGVLVGAARLAFHTGMVGQGLDIVQPEHLGQFLHLFTAQAVNDTRLALVGLDELDDFAVNILGFRTNLII